MSDPGRMRRPNLGGRRRAVDPLEVFDIQLHNVRKAKRGGLGRCRGVRKDGYRCRATAYHPGSLCWTHRDQVVPPDVVYGVDDRREKERAIEKARARLDPGPLPIHDEEG